jgi:hypothetical protein
MVHAQTPDQNQSKYWYYRYRLLNNFLKVGDCRGCSTPASTRGEDSHNQLYWGDGTIDLGWYIGVLATEYKLLIDNSQDGSETIKELYYALEAFNRLDYNAEIYLSNGFQNGSLNGFFVRDDVPAGFIGASNLPFSNYPHFNSGLVPSQCEPTPSNCEVSIASSDYTRHLGKGNPESLDQICHLMMGLSLVNSCVGSGVTYNEGSGTKQFMDNETGILNEAHNIVTRMIDWMLLNEWEIKNPVTGVNLTNNEGGDAQAFAYAFGEAACRATNKSNGNHAIDGITCTDYHDEFSGGALWVWEILQQPLEFSALIAHDSYNDHLVGLLAAIGNSWYLDDIIFPINTTNEKLSLYYTTLRAREYLPLLRQVLHGGGNFVSNNVYENLLDVAPCEGPYNRDGNYGQNDGLSDEWSTQNRFKQPEKRGSSNPFPRGEFNGLDYMLLFNLYSIAKNETNDPYISSYSNSMDRFVTIDFPFNGPFGFDIGSQAYPLQVGAFNTIVAVNNIGSDGDVTYRAGKEIALLPGFGADAGADFGAFIQPFHCSSQASDGTYIRTTHDSTTTPIIYNGPTTHVYYADAGNSHPVLQEGTSMPASKSTSNNNFQSTISITPNPTNGLFSIAIPENILSEIFIYNDLGQLVHQQIISATQQIDLTAQPKGIYFVKVKSADKVYTEKVIVQ